MKLYFTQPNHPWQPERYHYAAEQMMLTLFPGERPEYPGEALRTLDGGDSAAGFTLSRQGEEAVLTARVVREGKEAQASFPFPAGELDQAPEAVYHTVQHALKMAFYQAGVELLGYEPPWGALTGVRPVKLPSRAMKRGIKTSITTSNVTNRGARRESRLNSRTLHNSFFMMCTASN